MNTLLMIYLWVVFCTLLLLITEVALARKVSKNAATWDYTGIVVLVVLASIPPVGILVAWLIWQGRLRAMHATQWRKKE